LNRDNRLLALARQGKVTAEIVVAYLSGVLFMVRQTPVHLALAARRARETGREDLAGFFARKIAEEQGHDRWALDDFEELGRLFGTAAAQHPDASMIALAELLAGAIQRAPASYLAYILFTEHLTVLLGPVWLTALEERCGIPRRALSVVAKHAELDREHVQEALRELDALLTDADVPGLDHVLARASAQYDDFYARLADLAPEGVAPRATA
jgi:pyrroloquinoline quinone (PQQ) biosynthesis protein C